MHLTYILPHTVTIALSSDSGSPISYAMSTTHTDTLI